MLRKKEVYTTITPIPGFIPRQLAIDILHSHSEVITLNPLVLDHKPIKAPRDAASDEFYSTWYEIIERIQYIPGMGKLGSGKISFNGCFHDMPWGLQTHIYAPMNVDLRNKYRIGGNQPGVEPPEQTEIGLAELGAPADGLYLREDIEIKCNIAVVGFVKTQLKAASKEMVQRIIKKAELLDAGILHGMIEDGKLKTVNPADRTNTGMRSPTIPASSPSPSFTQTASPRISYQVPNPSSPGYIKPGTPSSQTPYPLAHHYHQPSELHAPPAGQQIIMELPGDYYHPQASPRSQAPQPSPTPTHFSNRDSSMSDPSRPSPDPNSWRWSQPQPSPSQIESQRTSISSQASLDGYGAGGADHKNYANELPTHRETQEEHNPNSIKKLEPAPRSHVYKYNPRDYAQVRN
jgi:hypothetical protein